MFSHILFFYNKFKESSYLVFATPPLVADADRGLGCAIPHPFLPLQLDGEDPSAQGADTSSLCQAANSTIIATVETTVV